MFASYFIARRVQICLRENITNLEIIYSKIQKFENFTKFKIIFLILDVWQSSEYNLDKYTWINPVDKGRKLNVHQTLLIYTFNIRPVSTG